MDDSHSIPYDQLSRPDPILFYAEIPLFEDELHDNGSSHLTVRIVSGLHRFGLTSITRFGFSVSCQRVYFSSLGLHYASITYSAEFLIQGYIALSKAIPQKYRMWYAKPLDGRLLMML